MLRSDLSIENGEGNLTTSLGVPKLNSHKLPFALLRHDGEWSGIKSSRSGKLDIIAEILLFCEHQKTKTSIMYNTNLNYSQIKTK